MGIQPHELKQLRDHRFPPEDLRWIPKTVRPDTRNGGHNVLCIVYVDARKIQALLDEVVGAHNWRNVYEPSKNDPTGQSIECQLGILIDRGDHSEWVFKADAADNSDIESTKGGHSSAFRRAAVHWGIARYLYDAPNIWVPCEVSNNNKFRRFLKEPMLPKEFYPDSPTRSQPQKRDQPKKKDRASQPRGKHPLWDKAISRGFTPEGAARFFKRWEGSTDQELSSRMGYIRAIPYNIVLADEEIDNKVGARKMRAINTAGSKLAKKYNQSWDTMRPNIVKTVTEGREESLTQICDREADHLLAALGLEMNG